ncbi:MAG: GTPase ObgE [Bacteroidota bacterium]
MKFIDCVRISVRGGHGGVGCVSFRREKYVPKGGPDGGNGGRGGSVILRANRHLTTLLDFRYRSIYHAPRGEHGLGGNKTGKSGSDITLDVPVGTIVRDLARGEILADLTSHGSSLITARGGRGGRGNAEFATATNQAPREFEQGDDGEERELELELKLLADVGLVGFPNAGKSTLISVISAARPKIADYPFTTLVPNLGIVRVDAGKTFVVADIPGLIEGAHLGKGLGVQFLRHIERTKALVFLLDVTRKDMKNDYHVLLHELREFNPQLTRKPRIVALTKVDTLGKKEATALGKLRFAGAKSYAVSAVAGTGVEKLVKAMFALVMHGGPPSPRRKGRIYPALTGREAGAPIPSDS